VAGGPLDFRHPRTLGNAVIDGPFTDLRRDGEGFARARLTAADGSCVELFLDAGYELLEVFTGDTLAPARRRTGLGLEPMTSPPNAFATGDRLIRLAPGESHRVSWGVGLTG
jgi:aldose 1-epimerase